MHASVCQSLAIFGINGQTSDMANPNREPGLSARAFAEPGGGNDT